MTLDPTAVCKLKEIVARLDAPVEISEIESMPRRIVNNLRRNTRAISRSRQHGLRSRSSANVATVTQLLRPRTRRKHKQRQYQHAIANTGKKLQSDTSEDRSNLRKQRRHPHRQALLRS